MYAWFHCLSPQFPFCESMEVRSISRNVYEPQKEMCTDQLQVSFYLPISLNAILLFFYKYKKIFYFHSAPHSKAFRIFLEPSIDRIMVHQVSQWLMGGWMVCDGVSNPSPGWGSRASLECSPPSSIALSTNIYC